MTQEALNKHAHMYSTYTQTLTHTLTLTKALVLTSSLPVPHLHRHTKGSVTETFSSQQSLLCLQFCCFITMDEQCTCVYDLVCKCVSVPHYLVSVWNLVLWCGSSVFTLSFQSVSFIQEQPPATEYTVQRIQISDLL